MSFAAAVECSYCRRGDHARCLGIFLRCECDDNGHPERDSEAGLL